MKRITALLLLFIALVISASLFVWFFVLNKSTQSIEQSQAVPVNAADIFRAYRENEQAASERYNGKVVAVTGVASAISVNRQGQKVIMLQTDDLMFAVNCTLEKDADIKEGNIVTLKGICSGFTTDVIIIRCYLIKK
ncbi:MAG: hypothetical protein KA160_09840 [Lacibacter sp.]|jgi:uncharacterized membrane protein|nr:hypothetical protein [Lacibacter sp.]